MHMATVVTPGVSPGSHGFGTEEKRVIFASSLGTVFEWYDFYLYAVLAPFFAALFFPAGNATAAGQRRGRSRTTRKPCGATRKRCPVSLRCRSRASLGRL